MARNPENCWLATEIKTQHNNENYVYLCVYFYKMLLHLEPVFILN